MVLDVLDSFTRVMTGKQYFSRSNLIFFLVLHQFSCAGIFIKTLLMPCTSLILTFFSHRIKDGKELWSITRQMGALLTPGVETHQSD